MAYGYKAGRGTKSWAGFAVADIPTTHKSATGFLTEKSFGIKQDVKWNTIPVVTPGMQEPNNYRVEGLHAVSGNVAFPFYPERGIELLKGILGSVSETSQIGQVVKVLITADDGGHTIGFQINSQTAISLTTTGSIEADTETLLADFNGVSQNLGQNPGASAAIATYVNSSNHALGILLTGRRAFTLAITNNTDTATQENISAGAITHKYLGGEDTPSVFYSLQQYEDLSCQNLVGCFPNQLEIDIEKGNAIGLNYSFLGMHGFDQKGTASYESFTPTGSTITVPAANSNTSDVTIDGNSTIITLTPGTYTPQQFADLFNAAIIANAGANLIDTYRRPLCACHWDADNNVLVFYSDQKGSAHTISIGTIAGWGFSAGVTTAGTNDNATPPTVDTVQPFIATRAILKQAGVEVPGVEKLKLTINAGFSQEDIIGYFFSPQPIISKRREVKLIVDMVFTDPTWQSKFIGNTEFSLEIDLETATEIGTTGIDYSGKIILGTCKVTTIPLPAISGPGVIKQQINFVCYENDTTQDVEIDLVNGLATV
jgi:Phage tail tube protein